MSQSFKELKYEIKNISNSPNSYTAVITTPEDLSLFKGPKSDFTTLTTESIIDLSLETLRSAFGVSAQLVKVRSSEFAVPITPNMKVVINTEQQDPYSWLFKWTVNGQFAANLDLDIATDLSFGC